MRRRRPTRRDRDQTVLWLLVWFMIAAGGASMILVSGGGPRAAMAETPAALPAVAPPAPAPIVAEPPRKAPTAKLAAIIPDQHFAGCNAARAAGRTDIPAWDPSYREWMDGDGDGFACEPHRYD